MKALNEAGYAAGLLNDALNLKPEDNLDFLDNSSEWLFDFKRDEITRIELVQERLSAIGEIERTEMYTTLQCQETSDLEAFILGGKVLWAKLVTDVIKAPFSRPLRNIEECQQRGLGS